MTKRQASPASVSEPPAAGEACAAIPPEILAAYEQLEAKLKERRPGEDLGLIRRAFEFAAQRHAGQKRASGEPYMAHPLAVADILAEMQMDHVCLVTALLHDTLEDTSATLEEIRRQFGEEVARCVNGVTKLSKIEMHNRE
ncbi:MAG: HD domain-containing protein, partial [Fimbriimonadales bacterium]